jgi:hypothetical protein
MMAIMAITVLTTVRAPETLNRDLLTEADATREGN